MNRLDVLFAFAVGPTAWARQGGRMSPVARWVQVLGLVGVVGAAVGLAVPVLARGRVAPALAASGAAVVLVAISFDVVASRSRPEVISATRVITISALALVAVATLSGWEVALVWPVALYLGVENAVMANLLSESASEAWRRVWSMISSPVHLVLLVALVGGLLTSQLRGLLELVILLEVWLLTGAAVWLAVGWALATVEREIAERSTQRVEQMGRHRAHWLHDDLCAEVRTLHLRLASAEFSAEQMQLELIELDDRLRHRQLDELISTGHVRAAEIIQPYVRRLQALGVSIRSTPSFDDTSIELDRASAERLRSVTAEMCANVAAVGATSVAVSLRVFHGIIELTVEDDAGGFGIGDRSAGLEFQTVRERLGPGQLTAVRVPGGTRVTARLPVGTGRRLEQHRT